MIMSAIQREATRTFNYSMDAGRQIPKSTNCCQQKLGETIYDLWFNLLWSLSSVYFPIAIIKKRTFNQTDIWIHIHGYINTDTEIFVICNMLGRQFKNWIICLTSINPTGNKSRGWRTHWRKNFSVLKGKRNN